MENETKLPERKHPRLDRFDYSTAGAYFITVCTQNRRCVLSRIVGRGLAPAEWGDPNAVERDLAPAVVLTSIGEIAKEQLFQLEKRYPFLAVDQYVIMPDHVHIILTITDPTLCNASEDMKNSVISQFVGTFKRFTNKAYGHNTRCA